ncbi:MAG: hypothetical protein B6242_11075 [Anaerolineaceae bacterium 4572_78]|nr:MAG: hypothetical protein B6242_11075 [Anaerolineaceae bacterium 4572_78]
MQAITLDLSPVVELTHDIFATICQYNQRFHFERTYKGELMIFHPAFTGTGGKNSYISGMLFMWNEKMRLGIAFDSSTGFTLPNSAIRSPDASWIPHERWNKLTHQEQHEQFSPICPDFVVELMSFSDRLKPTKEKMEEWQTNGCRLGWLIDTKNENVYIYRGDGSTDMIKSFDDIASGEDVLPDFELALERLR